MIVVQSLAPYWNGVSFQDVTTVLLGLTLGLKTLGVLYIIFAELSIPQPHDWVLMNQNIDYISTHLRDYLFQKGHYIIPNGLSDVNSNLRYDLLVDLYNTLKGSLVVTERIHTKLEAMRDQIAFEYFDQYNDQFRTMAENCTLVLSALRHLETQILLINPNFVTLAQQAIEPFM